MAARKIISVARRSVSSGSEDFMCKRSSSSNLLTSGVRFLSDLPDSRKDILARIDRNKEDLRRAKAEFQDLAAISDEFLGTTAKLREYRNAEVLKYHAHNERLNVYRGCVFATAFGMLLFIGVPSWGSPTNPGGLQLESEAN